MRREKFKATSSVLQEDNKACMNEPHPTTNRSSSHRVSSRFSLILHNHTHMPDRPISIQDLGIPIKVDIRTLWIWDYDLQQE